MSEIDDAVPGLEEESAEGEAPAEGAAPVEGAEGDGGEAPAEGEGAAPATELPPYVREMQERLEKAEKALQTRASEQPAAPSAPGQPGPEFFQQMEKDFGFSTVKGEDGRDVTVMDKGQFTKGMLRFGQDMLRMAREYADTTVHGSTSEIRTDAIISDLAAKTPDIRRFAPQIKEQLKKRYAAKDQSNPEFIMDCYYWAKGRSGGAPAGNTDRSKVRVITPASANRNGAPGKSKPLGAIERSMIGSQFKDEKELRAWRDADLSKL